MKPTSAYPFFLSGDIRTLEDCSSVEEFLRVMHAPYLEIRLDRTASFFVGPKFPENGADIMERNWAALTYLDDLESFILALDMVPWKLIDASEAHHTTSSKSDFELASALNNDMEGRVCTKPTEPDEYTIQMDYLANYMHVNHTIVHCSQFTLHETLEETGQSAVLRQLIEELLRTLQGARWFRRQRHEWRERDQEAVMQRPAMKQAMDVYLKFLDAFDNALGRFAER
ncbi:hypothetical protein BDZ97DRAFT_1784912 [Flammula alnicola]|nr:hypothetical protein BDZ97DRAFT_1784912 [Flammula alnicola]